MTRLFLVAGLGCAAAAAALAVVWPRGEDEAAPPTATRPSEPPAPVETAPPEPKGIPELAPPWRGAGAFVWHETDVDPVLLAGVLRSNGFAWAAVFLHDGPNEDPLVADWISRFRAAGGPPVGGWGVLREDPEADAELAARLLDLHGLGFYVANAELEYSAEGDPRRSDRFVSAFRRVLPRLPAALSTLCRPAAGFDLGPWRDGGFALLPQAYVNQFGGEVAPATCADGSSGPFPLARIHPTVGTWGDEAIDYGPLLAAAGTTGFSVYLAENTKPEEWTALGRAIVELGIAS